MILSKQTGNKEEMAQLFLVCLLMLMVLASWLCFHLIAGISSLLGLAIGGAVLTEVEIAISSSGWPL